MTDPIAKALERLEETSVNTLVTPNSHSSFYKADLSQELAALIRSKIIRVRETGVCRAAQAVVDAAREAMREMIAAADRLGEHHQHLSVSQLTHNKLYEALDELDSLRAACTENGLYIAQISDDHNRLRKENERLTSCIDAIEALHLAALTGTLEK